MSFYLQKLPTKKVEIIDEVSEYIGSQNAGEIEIHWQSFSNEFIQKALTLNKYVVCVMDNSSFDAAAVLENEYDIDRFCDVERDNDYRPHYYFLVDKQFIDKWK